MSNTLAETMAGESTQGPHDERLVAMIVPELMMMHGSRGEATAVAGASSSRNAALIAEISRQREEIAAMRRDLEARERQLVQLVSQVHR